MRSTGPLPSQPIVTSPIFRILRVPALAVSLLPLAAIAQPYPSKPVRMIIGLAPGGGADIMARESAQRLTESLGRSFVVDNRPAAGGSIAGELTPAEGKRFHVSRTCRQLSAKTRDRRIPQMSPVAHVLLEDPLLARAVPTDIENWQRLSACKVVVQAGRSPHGDLSPGEPQQFREHVRSPEARTGAPDRA